MPFVKGQSGNPAGPKPGSGRKQTISEALRAFLLGKEDGKPRLEKAVQRLYTEDLKTFMAYAYGKPVETNLNLTPETDLEAIADALARRRIQGGVNIPESNQDGSNGN